MTHSTEASRHNVYVIELDKEVLQFDEFLKANPKYKKGMPCLFVGETRHTPQKRFNYHLVGYKSHEFVRRYARRLAPEYYAGINPVSCASAKAEERLLADRLRGLGYAVWQHDNALNNQHIEHNKNHRLQADSQHHFGVV
ncbi:MAG: hypothetical protein PVG12_08445 [Gammaproteobacteria bacterium]|jgi:hypothetical protein